MCACSPAGLTPSAPSCKQVRSTDTSNLVQQFTGKVQTTDIGLITLGVMSSPTTYIDNNLPLAWCIVGRETVVRYISASVVLCVMGE